MIKTHHKTDFLGLSVIAIWLALSAFFGVTLNEELFQRLGAFGVGAAVLYFALIRHANPIPVHTIKFQHENTKLINEHEQMIQLGLQNTSVLAALIKKNMSEKREEIPKALDSLASSILSEDFVPNHSVDWLPRERKSSEITRELIEASGQVVKQKRFSKLFEVWIVVIATLQWGFGDLLIGYVKGVAH